MTHTERSKR